MNSLWWETGAALTKFIHVIKAVEPATWTIISFMDSSSSGKKIYSSVRDKYATSSLENIVLLELGGLFEEIYSYAIPVLKVLFSFPCIHY